VTPTFFATPRDFRAWLLAHHDTAKELLVGFYTKDSGRPSITWPQSVDEALSVGWIDGVRRNRDAESYTIRFTPRRQGSTWSAINIRRVAALKKAGRMQPAGLAAFARRSTKKSRTYSYEQRHLAKLTPAQARTFRANARAWTFFSAQPPGYRKLVIFWIASAKQEKTQRARLERLVNASAAGRRLI